MKPKILHLLSDRNVGGVTACTNSLIRSRLAEKFEFWLLSPDEALSQMSALKPDLIVFHDASAWKVLPILLKLRSHGKVLIHDHHYSKSFEAMNVPVKWRFHLVLKLAHAIANYVVTISHAQKAWMLDNKLVNPQKLLMIQQCRVLEGFLAVPVKPLGEKLILGVYGRFSNQKGIDLLLRAMQGLPALDVELLIGGYGENEAMLHQLADGDRRIQFVGKLADVPKFLEACDVVVIPSRWEPWGNVCVEAKAAGKPAIATNVDGLTEQIGDCGLIAEPTVESLKEAIAKVANIHKTSPQTLIEWGNNGREDVRGASERYLVAWECLFWQLTRKS
ncbi:glycosyltransferase family 4 protein [Tumidithrix elongata RA019]|uniref:Glycosyltransferase family 4 protein n=1 Tax=Tumidithrix elongata BACA0141 TaxID=2716417 RepID=A0AAW9Q2A0_9CYAN|nr:glycosyltransferase family 4 protein [Tumidithrix elongata RA019]